MFHNCKRVGYHRLGVPKYLDNVHRLFVRHCKSCAYIYAGKIIVNAEGKVSIKQMNHHVALNEQSMGDLDSHKVNVEPSDSPPQNP